MGIARDKLTRWRCRRLEGHLVELAEGTLERSRRGRVERHVARCSHCAEALASLREISTELRALEAHDPGEAFWLGQRNQIMASLPPVPAAERRTSIPLERSRWHVALAPVAAVLVAVVGYWLFHTTPGSWTGAGRDLEEGGDETVVALLEVSGSMFSEDSLLPNLDQDDEELWSSLAAQGWDERLVQVPDLATLTDDDIDAVAALIGEV
jgi:anti-sigma factor RsiW